MGMSLKEFLIVAGIVAAIVWVSMVRSSMERNTARFMRKLNAPRSGEGFGWKGLLLAFVLGIACCGLLALVVLRIWNTFHATSAL